MSFKKEIRKRSNWYIYLLTFLIVSAVLSFFVYNIREQLFRHKSLHTMSGTSGDSRPDASYNATFLFMLSERKGAVPDYYMLLNYRPRDEVIMLVPISKDLYAEVGSEKSTLDRHYQTGGAKGVMLAIQNSLGISAEHYIKFDKATFISFVDAVGLTTVTIPYTLKNEDITFAAGTHIFEGEDLYNYITFPDYNQDEDYRYMLHGVTLSSFINENSRGYSVTQLQAFFNIILNNTDTSLEFSDFTKNQQAYLYTTQNSYNTADFYTLSGEINEEGQFIPAPASLIMMREKLGLRADS